MRLSTPPRLSANVKIFKCLQKIDAFSNVKRCFLNVDELVKIYSSLIESKLYGIFNIGSKVTSYFDRIKTICDNKISSIRIQINWSIISGY